MKFSIDLSHGYFAASALRSARRLAKRCRSVVKQRSADTPLVAPCPEAGAGLTDRLANALALPSEFGQRLPHVGSPKAATNAVASGVLLPSQASIVAIACARRWLACLAGQRSKLALSILNWKTGFKRLSSGTHCDPTSVIEEASDIGADAERLAAKGKWPRSPVSVEREHGGRGIVVTVHS